MQPWCLAKPAGLKPRDLAETIAARLMIRRIPVESAEVAGPGFINLRLADDFWCRRLVDDPRGRHRHYGAGRAGPGPCRQCRVWSPPTPPARSMSAMPGVRWSAMCWRPCWPRPGSPSPGSTTSTMPAGRSMSSRARPICGTARLWARISARSLTGLYPGDYLVPVGQALADARFGDKWRDAAEAALACR